MSKWVDIKGYEGLYRISREGVIESIPRLCTHSYTNGVENKRKVSKRVMTQYLRDGYLSVSLTKDGKGTAYVVHRLLATHFIPNPKNYPVINHKNGIKTDNRLENLEWCTIQHNSQHSHDMGFSKSLKGEESVSSKLTSKDVKLIRKLYTSGKYYQRELAERFKVSRRCIGKVIKGDSWAHIPMEKI